MRWCKEVLHGHEAARGESGQTPSDAPMPEGAPAELCVDLGGGVKMEMTLIPAGSFLMGDELGDHFEQPVHPVTITQPFYLGKFQVTQEQWHAVMGTHPSSFKGPHNPVETVSWDDCREFLARLNEKFHPHGAGFGLPTEAQWEYACRAGTTTRWSFGDNPAQLDEYAWWEKNAHGTTHPVGQKKPNPWNLFDMHGNVWEWCADLWDPGYYVESPAEDPPGPDAGWFRVLRGGSWFNDYPIFFRCACRYSVVPGRRHRYYGLRVAMAARP